MVKVTEINEEKHKVSLSIRALLNGPIPYGYEVERDEEEPEEAEAEEPAPEEAPAAEAAEETAE